MSNSESKNNKDIIWKENSYNLTELIELSNGNNDFLENMIKIFIRSSTEIMTQMKNALLNNEWPEVSALAHKAIPSFHFIGLKNFSEKLKFIETNSNNSKEHKHISEMIGFIDKNLIIILADLENEIKKFKSSS